MKNLASTPTHSGLTLKVLLVYLSWYLVSEENTCELISTVIPRTNGIIRFTCTQPVYLPSTCTVMIANQQFTSSSIQINGNSFAFLPVIDSLTVNTEYPITFTQCNINTQAAITISTGISNSLLFLV